MLKVKDLNIGYAQKEILSGLNFAIGKGELIGLVGSNGIGKSTLLKTIIGSLKPLAGEITLDGKSPNSISSQELSKIISIVLTDKVGGFNLTVFDIVASGRIPYLNAFGQLKEEDVKIVNQSLETIGIKNISKSYFDELSDGQKQKVLIAKSLAQQTPVILMDEPTAFLDFESRIQLFQLLKQLVRDQQKTVIVSSHDLDVLFRNVDKVLYLKGNKDYHFETAENIKNFFK
ncbi:MAG TPA: ABC transporter ATP-binding protein [Bacteroidia bacterium]|jgi:iron complex transport system ATP-binding protein|nr:ABC transporter ATP-binding protein [Bacteroidia bacterium]